MSEEKINPNSPEEISQELSGDDLKDISGGLNKKLDSSQTKFNWQANSFWAKKGVAGGIKEFRSSKDIKQNPNWNNSDMEFDG